MLVQPSTPVPSPNPLTMRPFTSTISIDEARRRLNENVTPIERTEWVPIIEAAGRVAAADVAASIDVPPFSRSAMDGYAVVAADTTGASRQAPVRLRIVERIYTGQMPSKPSTSSSCAEIATGAPMPDGADAVVMVEETAAPAMTRLTCSAGRRPASTSDAAAATSLPATWWCAGSMCSIRAGSARWRRSERTEVEVYVRPRVAILSTGNEVIAPGPALSPGQIYDVNRFTLNAVVAAHGAAPEPHEPIADTVDELKDALDACGDADVIIFSGGSSVGERDLIVDLIARRGQMIFHGIAVKPGKPTAFARVGRAAFFGMPGNPTSCLSNAYILLVPFLRATARLPLYAPRTCGCRWQSASSRRPAAISSTRCNCATARRCRHSRARATSPACRRRTATSRSPPIRARSRRARSSR